MVVVPNEMGNVIFHKFCTSSPIRPGILLIYKFSLNSSYCDHSWWCRDLLCCGIISCLTQNRKFFATAPEIAKCGERMRVRRRRKRLQFSVRHAVEARTR